MEQGPDISALLSKCVAVVSSMWSALGSEFWSAIAGAVVGGLIAMLGQRQERRASQKEREDTRMAEAQSQGYSLLFKVMSIHATFKHLKDHVDERLEFGRSRNIRTVAPVLLPIANLPTAVEFSPSEMAMLLSLKNDDVFNAVYSLDRIHNSILPAWSAYEARRSMIPQQGENHAFDGEEGRAEFDFQRGSHLEALLFEVETMANQLAERAQRDFDEAEGAINQLVPLLNNRLRLSVGITNK